MNAVLQKTMHSLEAALRYNPESVDLMASLAEVYIRMGRFDERTMELCEAVLRHQADNALLRQAQSIGILIEQSRAVESGLKDNEPCPDRETLRASIEILNEFLANSEECADGWVAWTRFQILVGDFTAARRGLGRLRALEAEEEPASILRGSLDYVARDTALEPAQALELAHLYRELGAEPDALTLLEKLYDSGQTDLGPALLQTYCGQYPQEDPSCVPGSLRNRFFRLLLEHGDRELIGRWLSKASGAGLPVDEYSRDYARILLDMRQADLAWGVLLRLPLDAETREMMNELAHCYEACDQVEQAVTVLRHLNANTLVDPVAGHGTEHALALETELSMAELQVRNGRYPEALEKYVNALCLQPAIDCEILDHVDELLNHMHAPPIGPLLRLGAYFRNQQDHPKAMAYLEQARELEPMNPAVSEALENLYLEVLTQNPSLPRLRMELGRLYVDNGRYDEAMAQLRQAGTMPSLAPQVNRLMAEIYLLIERYSEALEKFRGCQIEESDLAALYQLHQRLMDRGSPREALTALDLITRVNPHWGDVQERINLLQDQVGHLQPEAVADPKMRELIGDLAVGRYQYMDRLGSGGMGVVYKVHDIRNGRTAAMKILRDSLSNSSKALDRFFREARIAATLRHANIVQIFDYNISNVAGQSYIVMEYVDGPSMREVIDRHFETGSDVNLPYITEVLYYAVQLADALQATHDKGIIHRDIKPDNIMITLQGMVKITDFGIVHIEEATFTPSGAMLGTPRYMAPEQVTGGQIDGRSDIYSVGILLYEALIGAPPFMSGDISYQQVHKIPVPPRDHNAVIPQSCNELILRCLAKRPEDRFAKAAELRTALAQMLEDLGGCVRYQTLNHTVVSEGAPVTQEEDFDLV